MAITISKTFPDTTSGQYWVITSIKITPPSAIVEVKCWVSSTTFSNGDEPIMGAGRTYSYADGFSEAEMNVEDVNPFTIAYLKLATEAYFV